MGGHLFAQPALRDKVDGRGRVGCGGTRIGLFSFARLSIGKVTDPNVLLLHSLPLVDLYAWIPTHI